MAYLNWNEKPGIELRVDLAKHPEVITLALSMDRLSELIESLESKDQYELRLDLTGGWTIYWKVREGDSRLLMSHPEKDQWVGAVSLNQFHYDQWLSELVNWKSSGQSIPVSLRLSDLRKSGSFSKISNLDVVLIPLK